MGKKILGLAFLFGFLLMPAIAKATEGAYIGLLGGVNLLQNEHHHHTGIVYKTGYAAGAFAGYGFCNDLRVEGEFLYRQNLIKHIKVRDGSLHPGHRSSYSLMANCLYDFDICYPVMPYLGIGLGADRDALTVKLPEGNSKEYRTKFAAQAILGFSYPVCDFTEMSIDYRYHWARSRQSNNTFTMGLKYIF